MKWKVAFAGLRHGHIITLYNRIKADPRFEIAAVCEEDDAAAVNAAEKWQIPVTCRNFAAMLKDVPFDILAVGDYYGIRGQRAIAALKAGKHILCDKPLCTSPDELALIRSLTEEKNLKTGIMLDLRTSPGITAAKELIDSGALGKIHALSFGGQHPLNYGKRPGWYFEKGRHGGTINDIAIHGLDAVQYLTGQRITGLTAAKCRNAFADQEPDFKDSAQLMFSTADGCSCMADVSYASPDKFGFTLPFYWRFTLWGKNGVAEFSALRGNVTFYDNVSGEVREISASGEGKEDYLETFTGELEGGKPQFGTAYLLDVTATALKLQQLADKE